MSKHFDIQTVPVDAADAVEQGNKLLADGYELYDMSGPALKYRKAVEPAEAAKAAAAAGGSNPEANRTAMLAAARAKQGDAPPASADAQEAADAGETGGKAPAASGGSKKGEAAKK